MKKTNKLILIILSILLSACSFAPKYQRPAVPVGCAYKEACPPPKGWSVAHPVSAELGQGAWWQMYNDPILNSLESQVVCANQNIQAAVARYDQARAQVGIAVADYFPTVTGIGNALRQENSHTIANPPPVPLFHDFLAATQFQYELDVWGKIRNNVATAKSLANASAADLAVIDLGQHADLATDYFALRGDDEKICVLDQTVIVYQKALQLTQHRFKGGAVPVEDVDQAQNQLETAKTLATDMRLKRAQLEHAIAVLIGQTPSCFALPAIAYKNTLVTVDPNLPSTLLERRPDIAEAEANVQAANSNIGVARAAFFPAFNLSSAIGFQSELISDLLKRPSLVWALGPTAAASLLNNGTMPLITQTIFDGGKLYNLSKQASAQYCETVANYRQAVLTAYQEVEDNLTAVRELDNENCTQTLATAAANRALVQAMYRYKGGLTTYLDVAVVQNIALAAQLNSVDIRTRRQIASIQLIKALGGGWKNPCLCGQTSYK